MMNLFKSPGRRFLVFLGVLGPGLIAAVADNDAGGVATYSLLASKYGYSILFLLLIITILLAVTQEMGARLTLVSGKGLGDLIREQYGVKVAVAIFVGLFIANLGSTAANIAGLMAGLSLLHLPLLPGLFFFLILIIFFISVGSYHTNQKIFLGASLLYIAYIFSALLAKPNWAEAFKNLVVPINMRFTTDYLFGAIALLGTTVTPWGQFFISSFINDKKLTAEKLKYEQLEIYIGAFITNFFAFFMIVAVAATLYKNGVVIKGAADAALAIVPFAGAFAGFLFGLGLLVASFMGAIIIPLTTAYAFSEFFGVEGSLDLPFTKSKSFYTLFLVQILISVSFVFIPYFSLFKIVLYTQSLNGILLPVIIYYLLRFTNNHEIVGRHTNNRFYNYFATGSAVVIVAASVLVVVGGVLGRV